MKGFGWMCGVVMTWLLATTAHATIITVGTTSDVFNSNASTCSLRAALYAVSTHAAFGGCAAGSGGDTILIPAGTYAITLLPVAGHPEQGGAFYLQNKAGDTTAIASSQGAGAAILDGSGIDVVFNISPGSGSTTLVVGLTIRGGTTGTSCGAAGLNFDCFTTTPNATLNVSDSWITANDGAGIHAGNGNVSLTRVSITDNANTGVILERTGTSTLDDVTISRNVGGAGGTSSYDGPGGLHIDLASGPTTIANTTIAYNTFVDSNSLDYGTLSAGGIAITGSPTPVVNVRNSIIANNLRGDRSPGGDCIGLIYSQGHNLLRDEVNCAIGGSTTGNLINTDPQLAPLFDYGHGLPTHLLRPGSPAIGAGNPAAAGSGGSACSRYDGRDFDRTTGSALCDIGAYQSHTDFTVTTTVDANDTNSSDGVCSISGGGCSLRAAISEANAASTFKTIRLPAGRFQMTIPPNYTFYDNSSGTFAVLSSSAVTIIGAGAGKTIIDGNGLDRVFSAFTLSGPESAFSLHDLTITGGNNVYATGGGAIETGDALLLDRVTIQNNRAPYGGGLAVGTGAHALIDASAIIDNSSTGTTIGGGGVFAGNGSMVQITNSTIAQNSAAAIGGGIVVYSGGQVSLAFDTITQNHVANGGGGIAFNGGGTYFVRDSIISDNSDASAQAPDCLANVQNLDWTLIRDTNGCAIGGPASSDVVRHQSPGLTGLAYQGGPTPTFGLNDYSVAHQLLQAEYECVDTDGVPMLVDQRGAARPTANYGDPAVGGYCDIGAFQGVTDVIFADSFQ